MSDESISNAGIIFIVWGKSHPVNPRSVRMMITSEGNKPTATHNFDEENQDMRQKVQKEG